MYLGVLWKVQEVVDLWGPQCGRNIRDRRDWTILLKSCLMSSKYHDNVFSYAMQYAEVENYSPHASIHCF